MGPLLHVLAAQRGRSRVAAVGSAGASWIVASLPPNVPFFLADRDVAAAGELFAEDENVHLREGSWRELEPEAPFDLLLARGVDAESIVRLLAPGGTVVADALPSHPALAVVEIAPFAALGVRVL